MYKISDRIIDFLMNTLENWRVDLTTGGQTRVELKIQTGDFQLNSLSFLLFVNSSDATELHNQEIYRRLQIYKFTNKDFVIV